jgi:hypothetical protein
MNFYHYQHIRDDIEDGDIVFVKGSWKKLTHALIMLFTHSNLYHVGIAFWMQSATGRRLFMLEAHGKSTRRIINLGFYEKYEMLVVKAPKPWETIEENALMKLGNVKYGYIEAFYIGLRDACMNWFGIKLPSWNLPAEVCSSLVARLYGMKDPIVSPQKLYENLQQISTTR